MKQISRIRISVDAEFVDPSLVREAASVALIVAP